MERGSEMTHTKTYYIEITQVNGGHIIRGRTSKDYRGDESWTKPVASTLECEDLGVMVNEIMNVVDSESDKR